MSKGLAKPRHPDSWLWEQLERSLPPAYLERLRQGYQNVFREYLLTVGPVPEEMGEVFEEQLNAAKLDSNVILGLLEAMEIRLDEEQLARHEQTIPSSMPPGDPTSCGLCKRVGNHDEDWLCYRDRDAIEEVAEKLREEGPRRALVPKAQPMITAAYNYIKLVDALDNGWEEILRIKQFHAQRDHAILNQLVRRSGRPSDPMYDEAHRLISQDLRGGFESRWTGS